MSSLPPSTQRSYRAACPNCGAPVEFRSPASAFAVCGFCRSTLVRDGDALRRIGICADLFDDHSPLQLGAAGVYQGAPFTLVGRLQYGHADGTWNEWHALFDSGDAVSPRAVWLSEDNGRYVMAVDAPLDASPPGAPSLVPGARVVVAGQDWSVASLTSARVIAAQGELPTSPELARSFAIVDLRNPRGEVGTLDFADPARPRWSIGRAVGLAELRMTGLADAAEKTLAARSTACPNCGAALEIMLASTQSIVCSQCKAVVDVSQGVGGDLRHYVQAGAGEPQIALGSVGTLALGGTAALPWQVVGYVERCEVARADDDEQTFWREYLLYHRTSGFAFIVDADDGWSWTVPLTGAPERFGDSVKHGGVLYRKLYDYAGRVTYVLGEFYWRLERDQLTDNSDYQGTGGASARRLNREETRSAETAEVVWSGGETLTVEAVMKAFQVGPASSAAWKRDAAPTALNGASLLAKIFLCGFVIVVVLLLWRCSGSSDCSQARATFGAASREYQNCMNARGGGFIGGLRTGGGAFGGYSSGGGHK